MNIVSADWSERHKELSKIIKKEDCFSEAADTILGLHGELHTSEVNGSKSKNAEINGSKSKNAVDLLFEDLQQNEISIMLTSKDETIAWAVWHIARIEDLTMNILVCNSSQVFNDSWRQRLRVSITDTGNAMSDDEIMEFSKKIDANELIQYRNAVGKRSREILLHLHSSDMKRKVEPGSIARILSEGGVTEQKDSIWLLDFWSKKDVAGIIMMPLTRHQTLHLNDCYRWKEKIRSKKAFSPYRTR